MLCRLQSRRWRRAEKKARRAILLLHPWGQAKGAGVGGC